MLGTNYICSVLLKTNLVQILHTYTIEKNMAFTSASWGKCQPFKYDNLSAEAYFIYTFYHSYQYYHVAVNKIKNMGGVPILCIRNPNDIGSKRFVLDWIAESQIHYFNFLEFVRNDFARFCIKIIRMRYQLMDQGKETLFRNIQNTGRWHYSALGSRRGSFVLLGSYVLIRFPSCYELPIFFRFAIAYL